MYGLRKIIQIDGFIPGKRTVVELDGHSIINGTNGAGKSSTLKLLSFFYGSDPSQLYSSASVQKSFVQFYLPRHTSHLIFEYERESGLCCVAVYRHKNGAKHAYRFLEGEFSEQRFSHKDASGQALYCIGHELKNHWQLLGLTCSKQIEVVTDYRAIIQNDISLINRNSDSRELRHLAASYCLGNRTTRMRYIERICAAINSRRGNMERMKDMLADIMAKEDLIFPRSPIHQDDVGLIKEISSLREFEKEIPNMKSVLQQHYERLDVEAQLASRGGQFKRAERDISNDIEKTDIELKNIEGRLDQLISEWEYLSERLNKNTREAKNEVESCENKIERLDEQYDEYEQQDMEQKVSDFDNIGGFMEEAKQVSDRYAKLNEEVGEEENALNRSLIDEHVRYDRSRTATQKNLDTANEKWQNSHQEYTSKREEVTERHRNEIETVQEEASLEREKLIEAKAIAQAVAGTGGPTEEERKSLTEIKHRVEKLEREVETERSVLREKQEQLDSARHRQNEADESLGKAKHKLHAEQEQLEQLHKLAFAEDGTWLQQLRETDPNWVENLGKAVNPDLLQRNDLHAERTEVETDTVFGWSVNLQAVPIPKYAESEKQLRADYSTQDETVRIAEGLVLEREADYKKSNSQYNKAEAAATAAQIALQNKSSQKEAAGQTYLRISAEVDDAVAERRIEAKKEVRQLEKEILTFDDALAKRINAIRNRHSEDLLELQGSWSLEESRIKQEETRWLQALTTLKEDHENRKKQIMDDFNKACSDKGVDSKTIEEAKKAVTQTKDKVELILNSASAVIQYREWKDIEWKKRHTLIVKLGELKAKYEHAKNEEQAKERIQNQKKKELKSEQDKVVFLLRRLNEQKEHLNIIRKRYSSYMKDVEVSAQTIPFDLLIQELLSLLDSNENMKNDLVYSVRQIDHKLLQHEGTQVAQAWLRRKENLRQKLNFNDPYEHNFFIELPQVLKVFIDEDVKSIRHARIEALRGAGKGLTDFFDHLQLINKRIKQQSRKITSAIEENMKIDALSSIGISMSSRIESLDYWKPLQGYSKSWQAWLDSGERELPDKEFLEEMSLLIDMLKSIKSGSQLRDYFDLHIHMVENGHERVIRNDHELDNSTSDGLRYLALCVIFIAISRLLCPDRQVLLHWPIDELGTLHGKNISRLFSMLDQGGIVMLAGFPSEDPVMLRHFRHRQIIDFHEGVRVIDVPESTLRERAMAHRNRQAVDEHFG